MPAIEEGEDRPPVEGTVALRSGALFRMEASEWTPIVDKDAVMEAAVLPWKEGRFLVPIFGSESTEPTFSVLGEPGIAAPDFSAVRALGITAIRASSTVGPSYPAPQYAALPTGEVFVFDTASGPNDTVREGVFRWAPEKGAVFEPLPMRKEYGAFFPQAIVARGPSDVYVAAAVVSEPFGPNFPGCPSIVYESLDGTYLAHFDGQAWTQIAFPGTGRFSSLTVAKDGALEIVTGWPLTAYQRPLFDGEVLPKQDRWTLAPGGSWQKQGS